MIRIYLVLAIPVLTLFVSAPLMGQAVSGPPVSSLTAVDTPGDEGRSITLEWQAEAENDQFLTIMRSTSREGEYESIGDAMSFDSTFTDAAVDDDIQYYYKLAYTAEDDTVYTGVTGPAVSKSNWFRMYRLNALVLTALMFILVVTFITIAKRGKELYIRRIAGLSAMDEAIGRATEMGRKILYIPGILSINEIQTIASLSILGHIAKQTAIYGAKIEVPNIDPLTFSAARETVKQSYMESGKPEQFSEDMVTYITYDQFAYAASVTGKMVREKPAANFMIGSFFAESLILAETGYSTGAIQIAGTADLAQLPFFVTTCDYTLIAEELYAASAYLSREPVLLGSIKAQDMIKAIIMTTIGIGIVTYAFGLEFVRNLLLVR
jgi:hypothetical protein